MPKRSGLVIALAVVTAVAGIAAYLLLPPWRTGDVPVTGHDASPEQVVSAYLDALNEHDCGTAEALVVHGAEGSARSWCESVASLEDIQIHEHVAEPPESSGHSAPDEVANVRVRFDLAWRPFSDDGSMEEGATAWTYLLVRASPSAPWRIFDQGVG